MPVVLTLNSGHSLGSFKRKDKYELWEEGVYVYLNVYEFYIVSYIPYLQPKRKMNLLRTYPTRTKHETQEIHIKKSGEHCFLKRMKLFFSWNYIFKSHMAASKHVQKVGLPTKCMAEYPLLKHRLQEHHLTFPSLLCKISCRFVYLKSSMLIIPGLIKVKPQIIFKNQFYSVAN